MILYNGVILSEEEVKISYEDRGYYFGDGIYEVFRVYNGHIYELEAHLNRLKRSADGIRMKLPYPAEQIGQMVIELLQVEQLTDGTIYLQITRGIAPRSHLFPEQPAPTLLGYCQHADRPLQALEQGITAVTMPDTRWLHCDLKTLNLLANTLAKQHAADQGVDESIFHRDGFVTECSASNIIIVKNNQLYTHPANHLILHGITRAVTIRLARALHISVHEQPFTVTELMSADEVFITGTTVEITPVVSIDGAAVGTGRPGPMTRKLQQAFERTLP